MNKIKEIKQEIRSLNSNDVWKLAEWLDEFKNELWDPQMEADAKAGKLDKLVESARKEIAAGKVRPL